MKLWVDDLRPAPDGYIWVQSVNGAKAEICCLEDLGEKIDVISLDHDSGAYYGCGGDYIRLLDWLEETDRNYPIHIHSQNIVGVENMRRIIEHNGWMEVKYDVRFFPNGRVYFLDKDILNEALEAGKEILIVMNSWSGGYAIAIGAEKRPAKWYDENANPDEVTYLMYSYNVENTEFSQEELSNFYKIIFTRGNQIYMKTGNQATYYNRFYFFDWDTSYSDFKKSYLYNGETEDQFKELAKEIDWKTTKNFMTTEKDYEAKIEALSIYSPFLNMEVKRNDD